MDAAAQSLDVGCAEIFDRIKRVAVWFSRETKLDIDELESAAFYGAVKYSKTYNSKRGTAFSTWCLVGAYGSMRDYRKSLSRKKPHLQLTNADLAREVNSGINSSLASEDSRKVLGLIFSPPPNLESRLKHRRTPENKQKELRKFLKKSRWKPQRIRRAFSECAGLIGVDL